MEKGEGGGAEKRGKGLGGEGENTNSVSGRMVNTRGRTLRRTPHRNKNKTERKSEDKGLQLHAFTLPSAKVLTDILLPQRKKVKT